MQAYSIYIYKISELSVPVITDVIEEINAAEVRSSSPDYFDDDMKDPNEVTGGVKKENGDFTISTPRKKRGRPRKEDCRTVLRGDLTYCCDHCDLKFISVRFQTFPVLCKLTVFTYIKFQSEFQRKYTGLITASILDQF